MPTQINIEELKTLIANGIREQNLHKALPEDAVEKIKQKILAMRNKNSEKEIPDIVSELEFSGGEDSNFPSTESLATSPEQQIDMTGETNSFHVDAGSSPTEQPSEPTMGYTPELPEMLKKAEPSEVFVFRYNDVTDNAENLSNKPLRLMDDPEVKKSMHDLWIEQGKTKAKVYSAKFEEIGEINFNYADGTSSFTEKASLPDHVGGNEYKENPYEAPSMPQIDEPTQNNLETYIKNSVDLEKVVRDIVMDIVKDSLLTNTEKAENSEDKSPVAVNPNNPSTPTLNDEGQYISEDIASKPYGYGTRHDQLVKPMEEEKDCEDEDLEITMKEIVEGDYERVVLPKELNESINSGDKSKIIKENEFVQEWGFNGEKFYIPTNRISKDKGYKKL